MKKNIKLIVIGITILVLLLLNVDDSIFCDENDVVAGSFLISEGQVLYNDVFSHHMPFPYYFMSIFSEMGANTVLEMRIAIAFILFGFMLFAYKRWGKQYSTELIIWAILYTVCKPIFSGQMVLADSFVAISLFTIFMEIYTNKKLEFSLTSKCIISISTFIAFTSSLIAIYPIIIFYGYYIFVRVKKYIKCNNFKQEFSKDIKFLGIVLLPFIIWIAYMIATNSLTNFIKSGIEFNTEYYTKFNAEDTPVTLVINHIKSFPEIFINSLKDLSSNMLDIKNINIETIFTKGAFIIFVINSIYCIMNKKKNALFITTFIYFTAMRQDPFHDAPFYLIVMFIISTIVLKILSDFKSRKYVYTLTLFCMFTLSMLLFQSYITSIRKNDLHLINPYIDIVKVVTEEKDKIWALPLYAEIYPETKRLPADKNIFYLPWQAAVENSEQDVIENLKNNDAKVIICDKNSSIWGYPLKEYASNILSWVEQNYFIIPSIGREIYFSNDHKTEIITDLVDAGYNI